MPNYKFSKNPFLKRNTTFLDKIASEDNSYGNFFAFVENQKSEEESNVPALPLLKKNIHSLLQRPLNNGYSISSKSSPLARKYSRALRSKIKFAKFMNQNL